MLAYSNGNHYDLVLTQQRVRSLAICQSVRRSRLCLLHH